MYKKLGNVWEELHTRFGEELAGMIEIEKIILEGLKDFVDSTPETPINMEE